MALIKSSPTLEGVKTLSKEQLKTNSFVDATDVMELKRMYCDINTLKIPSYLIRFIKDGKLKYVNPENPIVWVFYHEIVQSIFQNKGRDVSAMGSTESENFIKRLISDYENPEIGYLNYTNAPIFLPDVEGGVIKWRNHGYYHRVTSGKDGNFDAIPGIKLEWGDAIKGDWEKQEIIQSLHDEENNPFNHPSRFIVTDTDKISSLGKNKVIYDSIPDADKPLNSDGSVMDIEEYFHVKLKAMGVSSETTRLNLIDDFLGSNSKYKKIAKTLKGSKAATAQIKENYKPRKFNDVRGNLDFGKDWKGFVPAVQTDAISLFPDVPSLKIKPIIIKLDSYPREMWKALSDAQEGLVENKESFNVGLVFVLDMIIKNQEDFKSKRKEMISKVEKVIKTFNLGLKEQNAKGAIEILGMIGQLPEEQEEGLIFYNEF